MGEAPIILIFWVGDGGERHLEPRDLVSGGGLHIQLPHSLEIVLNPLFCSRKATRNISQEAGWLPYISPHRAKPRHASHLEPQVDFPPAAVCPTTSSARISNSSFGHLNTRTGHYLQYRGPAMSSAVLRSSISPYLVARQGPVALVGYRSFGLLSKQLQSSPSSLLSNDRAQRRSFNSIPGPGGNSLFGSPGPERGGSSSYFRKERLPANTIVK